jgi:hypothetical protein
VIYLPVYALYFYTYSLTSVEKEKDNG